MLDGVSLDQLRTFIAAADAGSFSAGARQLRRAQSVVSQTLANLEAQVGVKLFDRSRRAPVLTREGVALLAAAAAPARALGLGSGGCRRAAGRRCGPRAGGALPTAARWGLGAWGARGGAGRGGWRGGSISTTGG